MNTRTCTVPHPESRGWTWTSAKKWADVSKSQKADSEALHMGTRDEAMTGERHHAFILHNGHSVLCEDYQDCGHQLLATHTVAEQRTVKTGFSTTRS